MKRNRRVFLDQLSQLVGPPSSDSPRVTRKALSWCIDHAYSGAFESWLVYVLYNFSPEWGSSMVLPMMENSDNAEHCSNRNTLNWLMISSEKNRGRRTMAREIQPARVDYMGEAFISKVILNQFLAESSLHKSIRHDHSNPSRQGTP